MKTYGKLTVGLAFALALLCSARAADVSVTGKWKAEFDTQIGKQNYTFDIKADGEKVTGKATAVREGAPAREVDLIEGKLNKDEITFVEILKIQDQDIRIEYKGKISGDEIKLTRKVGDFGTTDAVAKRVKESDQKPDQKPPAAKP
jgi:hypothetical protein